jgi:hypothetical protein
MRQKMNRYDDVPYEPDFLGFCPDCIEEMYWGDLVYKYDNDYFCTAVCVANYVGAKLLRGGDDEVI